MSDALANLTQEKFNELSQELETLKTERRKEVAENLEYAKSLGDLSENAEYHEARGAQAQLEDRIAKLDRLLKSATIVSARRTSGTVGIGSHVHLKRMKDGKELAYKIVGSEEADITNGKMSAESPIAQAMAGKHAGDTFSVRTPSGENNYEIIAVE